MQFKEKLFYYQDQIILKTLLNVKIISMELYVEYL